MAEMLKGYAQLQARFRAISGPQAGEMLMKRLGMQAVREQKLLVARKTGNLGRSIHLAVVTPTSATTVASANYAAFVEYGTRPHEITPRAKKALAWASGPAGGQFRRLTGSTRKGVGRGDMHFAMRVHHPGTRPEPYMVPGAKLAIARANLTNVIVDEWNGAA